MRRIGGLYEQIADPDNLREAMAAAARGKRDRPSVRRFLRHASEELRALRAQLCAGDVAVDGYRFFMVYDPKPRRIAAPSFRDRVLHHALMRVVEPVFEAEALGASFACRKGKGLHRAVAQLRHETRRSRYFLQRDVSRFFDSVDHAVLRRALARKFKEEVLLRLFDVLLSSYEVAAGKGLPIGSLVSQHLANFYLGRLDRFVAEELRPRGFLRYMDDFVLWRDDPACLRDDRARVEEMAREVLRLELKPCSGVQATQRGVSMLGVDRRCPAAAFRRRETAPAA
jgi:RNA-directed DNA polymerase